MNIKNYTSETPVFRSIERIEKRLVDIGAKSVVKEYDSNKKIVGITFCIDINNSTVAFKMPAQVEKVFNLFWKHANPHRANKQKYLEQAERTAWKNVSEWIDIQASLVMMEQADFIQVFLPYAITKEGETVYDSFKKNPTKLLN